MTKKSIVLILSNLSRRFAPGLMMLVAMDGISLRAEHPFHALKVRVSAGDRAALKELNKHCGAGEGLACEYLAELYHAGDGVKQDPERAAEYFRLGCESNFLESCANRATMITNNKVKRASISDAIGLNRRACDAGNAHGCSNLALHYVTGNGVTKDFAVARKLYESACEPGFMEACLNLAIMYRDGEGMAKDPRKAAELFKRVCEAGASLPACRAWERTLVREIGDDVSRKAAYPLALKLCLAGDDVPCDDVVALYADGHGAIEDATTILEIGSRRCDGGTGFSCNNLGAIYGKGIGVEKDLVRSSSLYEQACKHGYAVGCYNLGVRYQWGGGVPKDESKTVAYFQLACRMGYQEACSHVGAP